MAALPLTNTQHSQGSLHISHFRNVASHFATSALFFSLLLEHVVFLVGMFSFVQYDCSAFTNILAFISADSPAVILQW